MNAARRTERIVPIVEAGHAMELGAWMRDLLAALVAHPERRDEILEANVGARAYWTGELWRVCAEGMPEGCRDELALGYGVGRLVSDLASATGTLIRRMGEGGIESLTLLDPRPRA